MASENDRLCRRVTIDSSALPSVHTASSSCSDRLSQYKMSEHVFDPTGKRETPSENGDRRNELEQTVHEEQLVAPGDATLDDTLSSVRLL